MHKPKILFLDEPSTGLDPLSRRKIHSLIRKLNREAGVCVFLTTHYIEEADLLSSRVVFMDHGQIAASGTAGELKAAIGNYALEYVENGEDRVSYFTSREEALSAAAAYGNSSVAIREVNLEDVYLKLTGRKMEGMYA
jgi:ABC-2 type transport system ATP-binding protein